MKQLCECGCGRKVTKEGNRFIHGHNGRGKIGPNKGKVGTMRGKTHSEETLVKMRGREPWNKGKTHSTKAIAKMRASHLGKVGPNKYNLKDWEEKCSLLLKVEEIKEDEDGKIWGRCTNHNCPNSKELGGWFILTNQQLYERGRALNNDTDNSCFYCSESCKETCSKFNKSAIVIQNNIEIVAGIQKEPLYTSEEYDTWKKEVFRRQKEELGFNECEYCGNRNVKELSAHHEKPQKTHPRLSLDPDNGIILCGATSKNKCHYKIGHRAGTDCSTGALANKVCI